ncbi:hypothetical protein PYCCODRAFT_1480792 [Trametes coccinea BRFM310]|uniref:Uncharacterized protein n=1 Tax=Trametes coccinea (strain BRFM310) TaxID=1353009 RepID=A0A1Y2IBW9_TRAC3|nr:hypothetical protein PYCCODRAFT_1480792 [Trametes coccinea BRFM310]
MYTNIDYAIATVKERGHALTVPNVLAAYMQCVSHATPEDTADPNAIAQAAIASFERAMDKYPAPAPPRLAKTNTATVMSATNPHSSEKAIDPAAAIEHECCRRPFSSEVAQLRNEYRKALWRVPDADYSGCTCPSCGSLLKVRSNAVRKISSDEEDSLLRWNVTAPVRAPRTQKVKKVARKKARAPKNVPLDPYAPSSSTTIL